MKKLLLSIILILPAFLFAQQNIMNPELLLSLGRVSGIGLSKDKQSIIYSVTTPNVALNKSTKKIYRIPLGGGTPQEVGKLDSLYASNRISPDGKYILSDSSVKLKKVYGKDYYPELPLSNVQIYESLNYRHWDEWEDGAFNHVFYAPMSKGKPTGTLTDIMPNELYDCPTKPFGDDADYIWAPDSKHIIYVTKKAY